MVDKQSDFDPTGLRDYIAECKKLGVVPASYFSRHIHGKAFVMKHYQLGPLGAKAIAKPFEVSWWSSYGSWSDYVEYKAMVASMAFKQFQRQKVNVIISKKPKM